MALACACSNESAEQRTAQRRSLPTVAPSAAAAATTATSGAAADRCAAAIGGMACVPVGSFVRGVADDLHRCRQGGQPADGTAAWLPRATIWLDAFLIDLTEVSNAAYRGCVERNKCNNVRPLYTDFDHPDQPITGVSWHDADRYCRAVGKRLPTEAEWEKAARGTDGELNPWGDAPATCDKAVIEDASGRSCGVARRGGLIGGGRVLAVKSRPPGRYGLYDMVGNAEEWVADWWASGKDDCGDGCFGKNPKGPCSGASHCPGHQHKVVRGGSWYWPAEHATGHHRRRHLPDNPREAYHHFGFRCAADPP